MPPRFANPFAQASRETTGQSPRPHTHSSLARESILSSSSKLTHLPDWNDQVSVLTQHHKIELVYPVLYLLKGTERAVLHRPLDADERYQPLPLIRDDDIWNNTGRDFLTAASFASYYPAVYDTFYEEILCENLFTDVREVTKYHGRTKIQMVIFKPAGDHGLQIRIRRTSKYRLKDGVEKALDMDYEMSLKDFTDAKYDSRWYRDALHLIGMNDDRAARSAQLVLAGYAGMAKRRLVGSDYGAEELYKTFAASFKPPRHPDYEVYVDGLTKRVKRSSFARLGKCAVCSGQFRKNHQPVGLPCCNIHVAKSCLVKACEDNNLDIFPPFQQPKCPRCEKQLFTDSRTIQHLKYNVLADLFWKDKRYTAYEDFERSCSDLDKRTASSNSASINVNPDLFKSIWTRMLTSGINPIDLPHLQLNECPEFKMVEEATFHHISLLSGFPATASHLHAFLTAQIWATLQSRFEAAGLDQYLPPGARGRGRFRKEIMTPMMWRDGLQEYVNMLLNRTIQFHELRYCECEAGFHWHQGREHWNLNGFVAVKLPRERLKEEEIKTWREETREGRAYISDFLSWQSK